MTSKECERRSVSTHDIIKRLKTLERKHKQDFSLIYVGRDSKSLSACQSLLMRSHKRLLVDKSSRAIGRRAE